MAMTEEEVQDEKMKKAMQAEEGEVEEVDRMEK